MTKHKWHDEIVAWAGGAEIEFKTISGEWICAPSPDWYGDDELRIGLKRRSICMRILILDLGK
jgi:hypothetical protein